MPWWEVNVNYKDIFKVLENAVNVIRRRGSSIEGSSRKTLIPRGGGRRQCFLSCRYLATVHGNSLSLLFRGVPREHQAHLHYNDPSVWGDLNTSTEELNLPKVLYWLS